MTNLLEEINKNLDKETTKKVKELRIQRQEKWYINFDSYKIVDFKKKIFEELKSFDDVIKNVDDIELTYVDRNKFDADLSIKVPALLQKYKKSYIKEIVPKLLDFLQNSSLVKNNIIKKLDSIWIYLNITLNDWFLFSCISEILQKQEKYWENDLKKWKDIVVDYSSPNVAKHLHAGHIRSTIIGHVLSNIYEKNGYTVHRVNHINDWGGFWYLIEWYNRWKDSLPDFENKNDLLFFIYTIYRTWEKASKSLEEFEKKDEKLSYFWEFNSWDDFKKLFKDFVLAWQARFKELEKWEKEIVELWQEMVSWSLEDFSRFYNLLWIHHDYVIWESFYAKMWVDLVFDLEKKWLVVKYDENLAKKDLEKLEKKLKNEEIDEKYFENLKKEIENDIWAYIIDLWNFERFVVLKKDKSSIYATRDLAAILYRAKTFSPEKIIYEVGQEQAEHFDKLFKSAKKLGLKDIDFKHIYHWFYVDAITKKKLSSRDWASNVIKLIEESIKYFEKKYENNDSFTEQEKKEIAYKLAIWSIIFNDIKQDKKNPVSIYWDLQKTFEIFEESWGAYVLYSIARANSILDKIKIDLNPENINFDKLENIEKIILLELTRFPLVVKQAFENHNPAIIIDFVLNLSRAYNSYYNSFRVIEKDEVIIYRAFITKWVSIVLKNALKICNIESINRI